MKLPIFFSLCLFLLVSFASAQESPLLRVGYGFVQAGNGDIPGSMFLLGAQKRVSKWSMLEVLASGTYIDRTIHYGQGYQLNKKSNGVALEATYNLMLQLGRFSLYPSAGPVVRYAHEVNANYVSIKYNQGMIVDFDARVTDDREFQLGYILAVNLDGRISKNITLGLRGTVQSFHTGQRLASLGLTFKNARWRF